MLVKVDKLIVPLNFIILDMDEDIEIPLIFGRPFLDTFKAIIDVSKGWMVLRVGDEDVEFKLPNAMKHSLNFNYPC